LREGKNFFIWGNFYEEFERYLKKKGRTKMAAFSIGALLGNMEGVRLMGIKEMYIWFPFLGPRGH
jgi:hypothetical protein